MGINAGDKVKFKGGKFNERTFEVGGLNGQGYDPETKQSDIRVLSVTFRAFGRGCRMNVPESEVEVVG